MDYQEQEKSNLLMPFLGIKTSKNIKKGAQKELLFLTLPSVIKVSLNQLLSSRANLCLT
jgi:hypothetical protein